MKLLTPITALLLAALALLYSPVEASAPDDYRLGPGDQVRITVFGEPDLSLVVRVGASGRVSYPFLGEITVSGKTVADLEQSIAAGLRGDYLVDPKVFVSVEEYRPVYVNGAVQAPASFPYVPGLTVRKAISMAGGLTERASEGKIFVIQEDDPSRTPMRADLDTPVRPGDIITVKESFF